MQFLEHDAEVLMLCEDLQEVLNKFRNKLHWSDDEDLALQKRLAQIEGAIDSERRLIEEIGLPGRFVVEHFTQILGEVNYSMGLQYRELKSSRGPLNALSVGQWGTITAKIGNVEVSWRDQDVQYMFYPDQVVVTESHKENALHLELRVAESDMGKVIGKQGRIARAIRTVVKAAGMKTDEKVIIDIV